MNNVAAELPVEAQRIVARFQVMVKSLFAEAGRIADASAFESIESRVRSQGQAMLGELLGQLAQRSIDAHHDAHRPCPHCRVSRRHKGTRPRTIACSLGRIRVAGVYWQCPACGLGEHAADRLFDGQMSVLLERMVGFLGVSTTSFRKAEQATRMLLGQRVDDQTVRRVCLQRGAALAHESPKRPPTTGPATGGCDGTMVHTRETGWREVKACRFEQGGQVTAAATAERVERFGPLLERTAERASLDPDQPLIFVSDAAGWIGRLVPRRLPEAHHVIDYWHACQHLFDAGKLLYGEHHPRAIKWGRYWSRRLRSRGGQAVADRVRPLAMRYLHRRQQKAVLRLARYLDKHASRMAYPTYETRGWPISSGPMESYCKQLGLRLKGRGMRWSAESISPMATLVSYWSYEAQPNLAAA